MDDVYIAGTGTTAFGRQPHRSIRSLAEEAVAAAMHDAGVEPDDIDLVVFANAVGGLITGQEMIRGQAALRNTGLLGRPILNVENACASSSTAFITAVYAVRSGEADVAIVVGAERLSHADRQRSLDAIGTAVDLEGLDALDRLLAARNGGATITNNAASRFMAIYATEARGYMERSGATREDIATVAVKNNHHGALNSRAQYGNASLTVGEVLASRTVIDPLTLLMCCPVSDGAAALVICSATAAKRLDATVGVAAAVLGSGTDDPGRLGAIPSAAAAAYRRSGYGPADLDVLEIHDAVACAELLLYEDLGLCAPGEAPALLASGATALGGRHVVNPSGGLLVRGHPIGATGCAQLAELADQLRGRCGRRQVEGARVAMAENGGGFLSHDVAAATVTILTRE